MWSYDLDRDFDNHDRKAWTTDLDLWFWRFGFVKAAMRERKWEISFMGFVDDNDIDLLYGIDKNLKLKKINK